jgi:CRP/FNR family transcriptional regulator
MHPPRDSLLATALPNLPPAARKNLAEAGQLARLPPGTRVFQAGEACEKFFIVLSGSVRVSRTSADGNTMVLYRVQGGETCILTTTALLGGTAWTADAVTETEVAALVLGPPAFLDLVARDAAFRRFAFGTYAARLAELMARVEEVAFAAIAPRLARVLLARAEGGRVALTQEQLAEEVATAREVVGRQLKAFAARGWLRAGRGVVELLDEEALAAIAEQDETSAVA